MKKFWFVGTLVLVMFSCGREINVTVAQTAESARKSLQVLGVVEVACSADRMACHGDWRPCLGRTESGIEYTALCDDYHCWDIKVKNR